MRPVDVSPCDGSRPRPVVEVHPSWTRAMAGVLFALLACGAGTSVLALPASGVPAAPSPKLPVSILEAPSKDADKPALSYPDIAEPDVALTLTIVEQAGKRSVLNVQATPFTHASGESVPPGLDGGVTPQQRIELGPYQSKALTLAAHLLRAGAWHSTLRVLDPRTNKAILTLPIDVARVRSEVPVQLVLPPAMPVELPLLGEAEPKPLTIRAMSNGGDFTLPSPALVQQLRRRTDDAKESTPASLALTGTHDIVVPAAGGTSFDVTVQGIGQAGRYDATLRFAPAGFKPLDGTLTFYARQSFLFALLFIFLGAVISRCIQAAVTVLRPTRLLEMSAIDLRSRLAAARGLARDDADATALVQAVDDALGDSWEAARSRRGSLSQEQLDVFAKVVGALPSWIEAHRQLGLIPANVAQPFRDQLESARQAFLSNPPDADQVQKHAEILRQMPAAIRAAMAAALKAMIDELRTALADARDPVLVTAREELVAIEPLLANLDGLEGVIKRFNAVVSQLISVLAGDITAHLENRFRPSTMSDAGWQALHEAVSPALDKSLHAPDAEQALQHLGEAIGAYAARVCRVWRDEVDTLPDDVRQKLLAKLDQVRQALEQNQLIQAWFSLDPLRDAIIEATTGRLMSAAVAKVAASSTPSAEFAGRGLFGIPAPYGQLAAPGAKATRMRSLTRIDVLVPLGVLVIASLSGLQALWVPDPTWGGGIDWLAALLWGLAFDQAGRFGMKALQVG